MAYRILVVDNDIDYREGLRRILSREGYNVKPHLPVLLITAFGDWWSYARAIDLGAADYLTKPFRIEELLDKVRKTLSEETEKGISGIRIRHLLVVDRGKPVGIVTEREIRRALQSGATSLEIHELLDFLDKVRVQDVMTTEIIAVTPDTPIEEAARIMVEKKIGCLPTLSGSPGGPPHRRRVGREGTTEEVS